jgi:hypothetical protein
MDREEQYKEYLYQEYLKSHAASNGGDKPNGTNVTQEMPDYISTGERMIAKNFANSPESQMKYYQQEHPDKEFAINDGEVVSRSKGDQQWKQIDPSFMSYFSMHTLQHPIETLKEAGRDIGDVAYDIPAGIGQGLATTAGFLASPKSRMAGASAASGAYGAASEGLRQGIGKLSGIPQDVKGSDMLTSGLLSAFMPKIAGVNLPTSATPELQAASQGLIKDGLNYVGPKAVQFATGISPEVQAVYKQNPDLYKQLYDEGGQYPIAQRLAAKVLGWGHDKNKALMKEAGDVQRATKDIDISGVKKVILDHIAELEAQPEISPKQASVIRGLKNTYHNILGLEKPIVPDAANIPQAQSIIGEIQQAATKDVNAVPANFSSIKPSPAPKPTYDPSHDSFLENIYGAVNGTVVEDGIALQKSANELANAATIKNQAERDNFIRSKMSEIKALQEKLAQTEKSNIQQGPGAFQLKQDIKGATTSLTSPTAVVDSRNANVEIPFGNAYDALNDAFDVASGGKTKVANKAAHDFAIEVLPQVEKHFSTNGQADAQKAFQTAQGMVMDRSSKLNAKDMLSKAVNSGELSIPEVNQLRTLNAFYGAGPSQFLQEAADATKNRSGLAKVMGTLGSLAGYKLGGGYSGAATGAGVGVMGGLGLSSKAAARGMMQLGNIVDQNSWANYMTNPAYYPANNQLLNPWSKPEDKP